MTELRFLLQISASANLHTKEQADFYRRESGVPLADRWRKAVSATIRSVRTMPERGALLKAEKEALRGLRWIPVKGFTKHLLFYYVDAALRTVFIIDVLHGARDIESELSMELGKNL